MEFALAIQLIFLTVLFRTGGTQARCKIGEPINGKRIRITTGGIRKLGYQDRES